MDFRALSLRNKGSTHGEDGEVLEIHRKSHRDFSIGCIARHDLVYNPPSLSSYRKSASKLVRGEMGAALRAVMRLLYIYTGMSRLFFGHSSPSGGGSAAYDVAVLVLPWKFCEKPS